MLRIATFAIAAAFALPALADTHISYVDDQGQAATQIYVKGGKVRMEGGMGQGVAIYDVASNSMTVLMPDRNRYLVLDEKAADQMGAQMNAAQQQAQAAMSAHQAEIDQAQQQMQAAMAQMTPEQRAQAQQMMGAQGTPGAPGTAAMQTGAPKMEMKDLGTTESVAGHSCHDMQMVMNGRPVSSLSITDSLASFGIPAADMKTLERMRDGMQKMSGHMGPMAQGMSAVLGKGFTLKSTHQSMDGYKRVTVTDTFKSVSTSGLSGSLFEVPAGYTQTTMQEMMQQHHP